MVESLGPTGFSFISSFKPMAFLVKAGDDDFFNIEGFGNCCASGGSCIVFSILREAGGEDEEAVVLLLGGLEVNLCVGCGEEWEGGGLWSA